MPRAQACVCLVVSGVSAACATRWCALSLDAWRVGVLALEQGDWAHTWGPLSAAWACRSGRLAAPHSGSAGLADNSDVFLFRTAKVRSWLALPPLLPFSPPLPSFSSPPPLLLPLPAFCMLSTAHIRGALGGALRHVQTHAQGAEAHAPSAGKGGKAPHARGGWDLTGHVPNRTLSSAVNMINMRPAPCTPM